MPVLVGTASWTDKTLLDCGRFYPASATTAEARLRFYASQFPLVEVDSSYYAMPAPNTAQLWAERTPNGFVMNVKAFRLFTGHQTSPAVLHKDIRAALPPSTKANLYYKDVPGEIRDELWRRFIEALAPLRAANRLGLVHFQFPPWLVCNAAGHAHVRHCVERMAGHALSVEFRHKSWFEGAHAASTLAFERELGVAHTVVDGPQGFVNSVPALWEATHPAFALLRLHGRNTETWNVKGASAASDRFNYDYSQAELADIAAKVARLALQAASTHVVFNNNMEDQGQRNAALLMRLLHR
ncbi:MAG: DUF72 domain-containing protein [Burkholderiales bacterium]|nr:DUF72 domain-containing protein [Burkholderiales bacterium]MDE2297097.1 DUF72 domain-containing protein [Burkholderiales bacterium]